MQGLWLVSFVAAWLITALQGLVTLSLLWAIGRIHLKSAPEAGVLMTDEGPHINQSMLQFEVRDHLGTLIKTEDYRQRPWVLLLLSDGCGPCDDLLRQISAVLRRTAAETQILIVMEASDYTVAEAAKNYGLTVPIIADDAGRLRETLVISRTPYGIAVDGEGNVRMKGVVNTGEQLEGLFFYRGRPMPGGHQWDPV